MEMIPRIYFCSIALRMAKEDILTELNPNADVLRRGISLLITKPEL